MPFGGIKVFELPVRVISPADVATGHSQELFKTTFGIACAGSYLTAFLMKELAAEVLSHLQFLGGPDEITFDRICEFAAKFHAHLHERTSTQLKFWYDLDFLLGGWCPHSRRIRVARFWTQDTPPQTQWTETLLNAEPVAVDAVGDPDACTRFRQLLQLNLDAGDCRVHYAMYRRLRDVMDDSDLPSVAGAIQHGEFDADGQFRLYGSFRHEIQDGQMSARTFVRGTDVEAVHQPGDPTDFFVTYSFLDPFGEDVRSYRADSFTTGAGERRPLDEIITLLPHNQKWPQQFAEERGFLEQILGSGVSGIDHVGSTAVEGMAAVPVIDIMARVASFGDSMSGPFNLTGLGYECCGNAGLAGRLLYRKRKERSFNLHVVEDSGVLWDQATKLRELLRTHPIEAREFSRHKARILNTGSWTLLRYLDARSGFFKTLLERAVADE